MNTELIRRLRSAAVVMSGLPQVADFNGSLLIISDTEVKEVTKVLDDAAASLEAGSAS